MAPAIVGFDEEDETPLDASQEHINGTRLPPGTVCESVVCPEAVVYRRLYWNELSSVALYRLPSSGTAFCETDFGKCFDANGSR